MEEFLEISWRNPGLNRRGSSCGRSPEEFLQKSLMKFLKKNLGRFPGGNIWKNSWSESLEGLLVEILGGIPGENPWKSFWSKFPELFLQEFLNKNYGEISGENPNRIFWTISPDEFLDEFYVEITRTVSLRKSPKKFLKEHSEEFLEEIQKGIPGGNPVRYIGGTSVECLEELLEISVRGLRWGIFRCILVEIRDGILGQIPAEIPKGFPGKITWWSLFLLNHS